ncbi:MAG: hypothetical protein AAGC64_11680 [Bacteroidota bacterium]
MDIIRVHKVIERPVNIVNVALLEGLTVQKHLGNIMAFDYSIELAMHRIVLNPALWPKGITEPFLNIQLKASKDEKFSTHLRSEINFKYKSFVPIRKYALKQIIKFEVSQILYEFKYRTEKWM